MSKDRTPRIYPTQDSGYDLAPAMKHGDLQEPLLGPDRRVLVNGRFIVAEMKTALRKFEPGDMLLLVGDPVAIGIACAIAAEKSGGELNVLKWNNRERDYFPVTVNLKRKVHA